MSVTGIWPWIAGALALVLLAAWALAGVRRREQDGLEEEAWDAPEAVPDPVAPLPAEPAPPPLDPTPVVPLPVPEPLPPAALASSPATSEPPAGVRDLVEPEPVAVPAGSSPASVAETIPEPFAVPSGRARLAFEFRPVRAGVNLVTATAEAEIIVSNTGDAPADAVRAEMRLISAHAGQDDEIAAIYAAPGGRPGVPPFALAPGETRQVRLTAALPREAIRVLTASDRPMFVPLAVVTVAGATRGGQTQAGQGFAIGIERPGSGKLAPFWLDAPSRMYNSVAALTQGAALEE